MRKVSINDFSGGIQESTISDDFSSRQWAQLRGIIPSTELNFESQWPIQTVGTSFTGVRSVFPLPSSAGTFLVAIKTDGTVCWVKAPAATTAFAATNALTWTQITTAANVAWASGDSTTQPAITIASNEDYKFICSMPVEVYKYVRVPNAGDLDNITADDDDANAPRGVASGVLIHSTTVNGSPDNSSQQALVAYVDSASSGSVKVIVFPHVRRFPNHGDEGDFINAKVLDNNNVETVVSINDGWPLTYTPSVRHHPYTYIDKNGALLPGSGIIPRGNVGTMKGGLLLLGDVEWRSTFNTVSTPLDSVPLLQVDGTPTFTTETKTARWPNGVPVTSRVIFNEGPGIIYSKGNTANPLGVASVVTNKVFVAGTATITTSVAHNYQAGDKVEVVIGDPLYDGIFDIVAVPTTTTFTYTRGSTVAASTAVTDAAARAFSYEYRTELGEYEEIPNSWTTYRIAASVPDTTVKVARQFNLATHILNDQTTGPYRGGIYFSAGELDSFDPRAVLLPGKTDVSIRGLHVLDDTVIAISTAGSDVDGVYRLRGLFSRLINYAGPSDPTAVRLELIRGGIGAAPRTSTVHKNFSCLWAEAGLVVFIDRLGGVWFTNGQECDRLDRFGPKPPVGATEDDHVASLGKHLFVFRGGRLLVFTLMSSGEGRGSGCWTEVNMPGTVSSMVGGQEEMYMVRTLSGVSRVVRMSPSAPVAERACDDGVPLTITVSTGSLGAVSDHKRTVWHRFGMTFTSPTSCTVGEVRVQSTGALHIGGSVSDNAVFPDVQYRVTLNRTFNNKGILGEFVVPAGIGPQAEVSATVSFTGFVQLQSASFWVTGQDARYGDK